MACNIGDSMTAGVLALVRKLQFNKLQFNTE